MRLDLRSIFNLRRREEERTEVPAPSLDEAENRLRMSTVEKELLHLLLKAVKRAEEKGVIHDTEAKNLNAKYDKELEKIEEDINKSQKLLKLYELSRVRDTLYSGYMERVKTVENAMKEIAASIGEEDYILKYPSNTHSKSEVKKKNTKPRKIERLKEDILKVMQKLEEMEKD